MDYIKKLLQALLDTLVPPGTIIMFGGTQVPDGYILVQNVKVYQDEFPRLYPILAACAELEKGNDSGRAWVKMVNPDGRVPQFTTSGSLVWQLLEASLPNIVGKTRYAAWLDEGVTTGPFSADPDQQRLYPMYNSSSSHYTGLIFDASDANSIYAGTSLQSSALQCLACIKI